jgi:hypothetical protein
MKENRALSWPVANPAGESAITTALKLPTDPLVRAGRVTVSEP